MKNGRATKVTLKCYLVFLIMTIYFLALWLAPSLARDKITVEMYGFKLGSTGYIATFALAELINSKSDWVRGIAIESPLGSTENARIIIAHPEKQDRMLGNIDNMTMWALLNGKPPFKEPFNDMRSIAQTSMFAQYFITTKPNIKSVEDIRGKRVGLSPKGGITEQMAKMLLQYGYGITYNDIRVSFLDFNAIADALIDGTIDIGYAAGSTFESEPFDMLPNPAMLRMFTTKECRVIPISKEAVDKTRKAWGAPFYSVNTRTKVIGKTSVPEARAFVVSSGWVVTKHMPDGLVTEILRIVYENVDQFGKYHASLKPMGKENIAARAEPKSWFHPAAVKFYESKGLKVGMD